jgi:hypothetical protein
LSKKERVGSRLLEDLRGSKKREGIEFHHVVPRSCDGVPLYISGEVVVTRGDLILRKSNKRPMNGPQHALAHWICAQSLRASGQYRLARDHWHTSKGIFWRTTDLTPADVVDFAVLGIVGGYLVEDLCAMPDRRSCLKH